MQLPRKSHKLSKSLVTLGLIAAVGVLLSGGIFVYKKLQVNNSQPQPQSDIYKQKVDLSEPTEDQLKSAQATKEQSLTENSTGTSPATTDANFIITAKNVNISSSTLQIRTLLSDVASQGTCILTLTKSSATVSRNVAIQAGPADSTCQGFDIPLSELSNGTWAIRITVTAPNINKTIEDKIDVSGV